MTADTTPGTSVQAAAHAAAGVTARMKAATDWFGLLAPSHADNPRAFVQLSMAQFAKIKGLREAAEANPESMLSAMAECARLGLMPGDTGFYVPFNNKKAKGGVEVVFITHWTGEVELMYRTGEIETVVAQVVRAADKFAWDPYTMRVPQHYIGPNAHGQAGLAATSDRGPLTGVYCYVRFHTGGTSFPTVMRPDEVLKHRAISKAGDNFWGPDWPAEGPWTPDMWLKTVIKKHRGSVPRSPEYRATVLAASTPAAVDAAPTGVDPAANREEIDPPPMDALPAGEGERPSPTTVQGRAEQRRDERPRTKAENLRRLGDLFATVGLGGPQWQPVRLGLAGVFAAEPGHPRPVITAAKDLHAAQAARAVAAFEHNLDRYAAASVDAKAALLTAAWTEQIWDGTDPPPPPGFTLPGPAGQQILNDLPSPAPQDTPQDTPQDAPQDAPQDGSPGER